MSAIPDHILVFLLLVVAPAWGARAYRALVREIREGNPAARLREYKSTVVLEWGLSLVLLAWWWIAGRGLAALGLDLPPGLPTIFGVFLTALGLAFLAQQWRAMTRLKGERLDAVRAQAASVSDMLPRTEVEHRWFRVLSITAGICEELIFRGFLVWYLGQWMPLWLAAVVAAVAFGLAHFYQGGMGVVKTGVIGLIMGALFVATGSLLWPMILHAAVDLQGGAAAKLLLVEEARGA
jgi:membrane protease YdiL (CAAX protease family)